MRAAARPTAVPTVRSSRRRVHRYTRVLHYLHGRLVEGVVVGENEHGDYDDDHRRHDTAPEHEATMTAFHAG
jgi:hypothetical protein